MLLWYLKLASNSTKSGHLRTGCHPNLYDTLLLLGGELLAERCRTDDLLPNIPISCLPPCCMDPKVQGLDILVIVLSQVARGRPTGLLQSVGGFRAAAMTRWWSSSGAERARCPKNLTRKDFWALALYKYTYFIDIDIDKKVDVLYCEKECWVSPWRAWYSWAQWAQARRSRTTCDPSTADTCRAV